MTKNNYPPIILICSLLICIGFNIYLLKESINYSYFQQNVLRSKKITYLIQAALAVKDLSVEQTKKIIDSYHSTHTSTFVSVDPKYSIRVRNKNGNIEAQIKQKNKKFYQTIDHKELQSLFNNQPVFHKTISISDGHGQWINFKYYRDFQNHLLNLDIIILVLSLFLEILAVIVFGLHIRANRKFSIPLRKLKRDIEHLQAANFKNIPLPRKGSNILQEAVSAINELQKKNSLLNKERDIIFASLSHEINTPLTRIKLRMQKLSMSSIDKQKIIENIRQITEILDEMMNFAKFNYQEYKESKIELVSAIESVVSEIEDLGLPIQFHSTVDRINVLANYDLLNNAFNNLMSNAIKYGRKAIVSLQKVNEKVRVTIDDHGSGLSSAEINCLFQPFYRANKHKDIDGHGLGLCMAKSIIEKHGGTIECMPSDNYSGITVQIFLPIIMNTLQNEAL